MGIDNIAVQRGVIVEAASSLRSLVSEWENTPDVPVDQFYKSCGPSAEMLNKYAYKTHLVTLHLANLMENSREYFRTISASFANADDEAAKLIGKHG